MKLQINRANEVGYTYLLYYCENKLIGVESFYKGFYKDPLLIIEFVYDLHETPWCLTEKQGTVFGVRIRGLVFQKSQLCSRELW
jgi:hypothetical protein